MYWWWVWLPSSRLYRRVECEFNWSLIKLLSECSSVSTVLFDQPMMLLLLLLLVRLADRLPLSLSNSCQREKHPPATCWGDHSPFVCVCLSDGMRCNADIEQSTVILLRRLWFGRIGGGGVGVDCIIESKCGKSLCPRGCRTCGISGRRHASCFIEIETSCVLEGFLRNYTKPCRTPRPVVKIPVARAVA